MRPHTRKVRPQPLLAVAEIFAAVDKDFDPADQELVDRWLQTVEAMAAVPARTAAGRRAKAAILVAVALREEFTGQSFVDWRLSMPQPLAHAQLADRASAALRSLAVSLAGDVLATAR